jgi:hypothetical protein
VNTEGTIQRAGVCAPVIHWKIVVTVHIVLLPSRRRSRRYELAGSCRVPSDICCASCAVLERLMTPTERRYRAALRKVTRMYHQTFRCKPPYLNNCPGCIARAALDPQWARREREKGQKG